MKTLIIAEKPSVGRDIAGALDGVFQKRTLADLSPKAKKATKDEPTFLESDDYVIAWAVGHLVQLAEPEEYDEKWKKWRMADLPIVPPDGFKLVPRDAKSKKQLKLVETLLKRDDVDHVINACDAGREGELIFAYLYESVFGTRRRARRAEAGRAPLDQLDDEDGDPRRLRAAAPRRASSAARVGCRAPLRGRLARRHERDPRRDDPRPRLGRRRRLARPCPDPDARDHRRREREIQAFVPEPYWLVHATFDPRYEGLWFDPIKADDKDTPTGQETVAQGAERAQEIVDKVSGKTGTVESVERKEQSQSAPLLYDLTSLQRDANSRFGFSARRTLQAAQSLYEGKKAITYPRTSSRYLSGDLVLS
jgi:DNA topoisomerase-3